MSVILQLLLDTHIVLLQVELRLLQRLLVAQVVNDLMDKSFIKVEHPKAGILQQMDLNRLKYSTLGHQCLVLAPIEGHRYLGSRPQWMDLMDFMVIIDTFFFFINYYILVLTCLDIQ